MQKTLCKTFRWFPTAFHVADRVTYCCYCCGFRIVPHTVVGKPFSNNITEFQVLIECCDSQIGTMSRTVPILGHCWMQMHCQVKFQSNLTYMLRLLVIVD